MAIVGLRLVVGSAYQQHHDVRSTEVLFYHGLNSLSGLNGRLFGRFGSDKAGQIEENEPRHSGALDFDSDRNRIKHFSIPLEVLIVLLYPTQQLLFSDQRIVKCD
jgi:hypothetical protein